jgi:hypothetical protein
MASQAADFQDSLQGDVCLKSRAAVRVAMPASEHNMTPVDTQCSKLVQSLMTWLLTVTLCIAGRAGVALQGCLLCLHGLQGTCA